LAGAVGVDGEGPAQLVEQDVVVPPTIIFEVDEAGGATVGAMVHVVRFAAGGGLITAAGVAAALVPQGDQAAEVDGDVAALPDIQRQGGAGEGFAEQVAP